MADAPKSVGPAPAPVRRGPARRGPARRGRPTRGPHGDVYGVRVKVVRGRWPRESPRGGRSWSGSSLTTSSPYRAVLLRVRVLQPVAWAQACSRFSASGCGPHGSLRQKLEGRYTNDWRSRGFAPDRTLQPWCIIRVQTETATVDLNAWIRCQPTRSTRACYSGRGATAGIHPVAPNEVAVRRGA